MFRPVPQKWLDPFVTRPTISALEYESSYTPHLPRRTALNWLNRMRTMGLVERMGETRATIYQLTPYGRERISRCSAEPTLRVSEDDGMRPLGADALRTYLRKPAMERKPVGYQQKFLESYQPNRTFYLGEELRRKLMMMGNQTGMVEEPAGTYARHICQRLLIDLSWNSSRLEGNTYSLLETEQLLQVGLCDDGQLTDEAIMILNHKAAIEFLLESSTEAQFDHRTILNLHALLAADLLRNSSLEGALRCTPVGIGKSSYLPLAIPALLEKMFDLVLEKARAIRDPFEQSFFAMVHLPYLQPFIDGNKRVSRLAANLPLFQHKLAPLSFINVSQSDYTEAMLAIYELNDITLLRDVFFEAYQRSAEQYTVISGVIGAPDPFRIQYRQAISEQVAQIIRARCGRNDAVARLRAWAEDAVIASDRKRFVATAEEMLSGIHAGNFARYRVRPSEYEEWQSVWNGKVCR